jgi:hypothetical protein
MGLARAGSALGSARLFPRGSPQALALLRALWPAAVGDEVARRTELIYVEAGTLRVAVPDGRWRLALHRMRREILARLREAAGDLAPRRLGFSERSLPPPPEAVPKAPRAVPRGASAASAALREAASAIGDPELRTRFLDVASRYLARFEAETP